MRKVSPRRRQLNAAALPVREQLKARVGRCEVCLKQREPEMLAAHEIARGVHRARCLDKPFGLLIVDREPNWRKGVDCHKLIQDWKEPKQLALLYCVRPSDFDLAAYNAMVRPQAPNRITWDEVDAFVDEIEEALLEVRR